MMNLRESGDTIVEVMIAVAVVGAVLAGAFVSANRSTQGIRQSQERAEALKFTESQIESLRAEAAAQNPAIYTTVSDFCIDTNNILQPMAGGPVPCEFGPDGRYKTRVSRGAGDTFTIETTWDRVDGNAVEKITIIYRLPQ